MLWQKTLFPGQVATDSKIRIASLLVLVILPAILLYPCLHFHLLEPDEGRYAEIPREMLARGEWVVPYLQGEPYLDKPPLLYWLVMLSYSVFGVHDWAARLVPALAVHGTILMTYLFGATGSASGRLSRRVAFEPRAGIHGHGPTADARWVADVLGHARLFAGWSSSAPAAQAWALVADCAALACGLGVLTKGPGRVVLVVPPLLLFRWLQSRTSTASRPIAAAGCSSPHRARDQAALVHRHLRSADRSSARTSSVQHNLQRFLAPFDHLEPIWYYVPILLAGLLPGTLLLWRSAHLVSGDPGVSDRRTAESGLRAAGRRLVRAVFFAVGLQAADLHHAGISDAVPGARNPQAGAWQHVDSRSHGSPWWSSPITPRSLGTQSTVRRWGRPPLNCEPTAAIQRRSCAAIPGVATRPGFTCSATICKRRAASSCTCSSPIC